MEQVGLLGDFPEQGAALLILSILSSGSLAAPGHLAFIAGLTGRTHFDGGVLKRSGCNSHLVPTLQDQLHHFCMDQPMD